MSWNPEEKFAAEIALLDVARDTVWRVGEKIRERNRVGGDISERLFEGYRKFNYDVCQAANKIESLSKRLRKVKEKK